MITPLSEDKNASASSLPAQIKKAEAAPEPASETDSPEVVAPASEASMEAAPIEGTETAPEEAPAEVKPKKVRKPRAEKKTAETDAVVAPPPQPFLKWAGGKRRLLDEITALLPGRFSVYHEPFLGGGALFFHLRANGFTGEAHLGDAAPFLVQAYRGVRDRLPDVIGHLRGMKNEEDFFYEQRDQLNKEPGDIAERAASVIFLNKTCFNGLFRTNSKGEFNAPFGRYKNPNFCDVPVLEAASKALRAAHVRLEDFWMVTKRARQGDFVYFDPPYLPLKEGSDYTGYTAEGFGIEDHQTLASAIRVLTARGVFVMISGSDSPMTREIYAGLKVHPVQVTRPISRDAETRGRVGEVILTNY